MKINFKINPKIRAFIEKISSEPVIGAVQFTDASLKYVSIKNQNSVINYSVPLPPGVMKEGIVADKKVLVENLMKLHELIRPGKKNDLIKAAVSLPAAVVYTQGFRIPYIDESRLQESAKLNLQMISPISAENSYMSWQKIGEADDQYELLGAFADKSHVDDLKSALLLARFQPVNFEFPALGLVKTANTVFGVREETLLIVEVSSDGIDFVIAKNGSLSFDYFVSWIKIQGNGEQITEEIFKNTLARELQKVANFVLSHFHENLENVAFIAPNLESVIQEMFQGLGLKIFNFPDFQNLPSPWASVIGTAIKSPLSTEGGRYINLGAQSESDVFFEERLFGFIALWRNVSVAILGFLVLLHGASATTLALHIKKLESQTSGGKNQTQEELSNLENKAKEFNQYVNTIKSTRESLVNWPNLFSALQKITGENSITISSLNVNNEDRIINMEAEAVSRDAVLKFKTILADSGAYENVSLPISRVGGGPSGSVTFFISFRLKS